MGDTKHVIFGFVDPRTERVFHVGCGIAGDPQLRRLPKAVADYITDMGGAPQRVILQAVESSPLFAWVKWSKRFRRDIVTNDWTQFNEQADVLTNSNRVKRAMGFDVPSDTTYQEKFHEFDRQNPELFQAMLRTAQALKAEGRDIFGMDLIINEIRWEGADTSRTDRFKINDSHRAFYARKLQMADPSLCGLFAMRVSFADALVLDDGRSWQDFVKEHASELRFVETADADADLDWSY
jgi:hypothetical protein